MADIVVFPECWARLAAWRVRGPEMGLMDLIPATSTDCPEAAWCGPVDWPSTRSGLVEGQMLWTGLLRHRADGYGGGAMTSTAWG